MSDFNYSYWQPQDHETPDKTAYLSEKDLNYQKSRAVPKTVKNFQEPPRYL